MMLARFVAVCIAMRVQRVGRMRRERLLLREFCDVCSMSAMLRRECSVWANATCVQRVG